MNLELPIFQVSSIADRMYGEESSINNVPSYNYDAMKSKTARDDFLMDDLVLDGYRTQIPSAEYSHIPVEQKSLLQYKDSNPLSLYGGNKSDGNFQTQQTPHKENNTVTFVAPSTAVRDDSNCGTGAPVFPTHREIYKAELENKEILDAIANKRARLMVLENQIDRNECEIRAHELREEKVEQKKTEKVLLQSQKEKVEQMMKEEIDEKRQKNYEEKNKLLKQVEISKEKVIHEKKVQAAERRMLSEVMEERRKRDESEYIALVRQHADELRKFRPTWRERLQKRVGQIRLDMEQEQVGQMVALEREKQRNTQILHSLEEEEAKMLERAGIVRSKRDSVIGRE